MPVLVNYLCNIVEKKLSTILQLYEPLKVKAMHIKSFMHHELLRYATIGYIINYGCDLQVVYSQQGRSSFGCGGCKTVGKLTTRFTVQLLRTLETEEGIKG